MGYGTSGRAAPDGKPAIDSRGKMALVLHREANVEWKVKQEIWNQAPKE
jgi:ketosteroid isomerase-like protein